MNVTIVGNGNLGQAIAAALAPSHHKVRFAVRRPDPHDPAQGALADTIAGADVVILAIPHAAAPAVISEGKGFDGKIVVDATNPIVRSDHGPALGIGWSSSGAEEIAKRAPKAKVFKTFNQTGFENLHHARDYAAPPSMFVAGDDPAGKTIVLQLVQDAGFEAIDFGALDGARLLEPLALIWIELARLRGHGPDIAFTLERKPTP